MRGIVICVDYDDLLRITLRRNMRFLESCLVVTAPHDGRTLEVCEGVPGVETLTTDAFYRDGASFNKGLAMEEGFDEMRRLWDPLEWVLVWDADTLFPDDMDSAMPKLRPGVLYSPFRMLLEDASLWHPEFNWLHAQLACNTLGIFAGYYQLFHAEDLVLKTRPWYDVTYTHAGGGDYRFQNRWCPTNKIRPNFRVLHIGRRDSNWFGRQTPRLDGGTVEDAAVHKMLMDEMIEKRTAWPGGQLEAEYRLKK